MEIQDRNMIVQQTITPKLNLFQVSDVEGSVFAEILKTSAEKNSVEQPKNIENLQEARNKIPQIKVSDRKTDLPQRTTEKSKTEDVGKKGTKVAVQKETGGNKEIDNERNTQNVSGQYQGQKEEISQDVKEEIPEGIETESSTNSDVETIITAENELVEGVMIQEKDAESEATIEVVETPNVVFVAAPAVAETLVNNRDIITENQNDIEVVNTETEKGVPEERARQNSEVISENVPLPETKEEALMMEQARYLDEKASFGRKLKIEVDVKEEKIAAPIEKDVLKNRFEIDSMFQSVDDETKEFFETSGTPKIEATTQDAVTQNPQKTWQPQLGVAPASISENSAQSHHQETSVFEITEVAASGKEGIVETANALRNEAFTRINETTSRDTIRGMSKEVVEQIKVNITKSAIKGIDTVEIQLKPEDLGKIQIRMHIAKDGRLQADIVAGRAETLEMLQKEVSNLAEAFNEVGYNTDSKSFNFSFQRENQFADHQQQDKSGLPRFLDKNIGQEGDVFENDNLFYDPALGLNIRV